MPIESKSHDRAPIWVTLAAIGGAIIGATITGSFSYFSHQRDLDAKMIELSIGILRSKPTPETEPLREWAIDALDKRARFSFDKRQRAILLEKPLPFRAAFGDQYDWQAVGGIVGPKGIIDKSRNVRVCLNETSKWDCPPNAECGPNKDACTFK